MELGTQGSRGWIKTQAEEPSESGRDGGMKDLLT